jgi:hypothetical protein
MQTEVLVVEESQHLGMRMKWKLVTNDYRERCVNLVVLTLGPTVFSRDQRESIDRIGTVSNTRLGRYRM